MNLAELEHCYAHEVGWGADWREDQVAVSIFNFMKAAHDLVTEDMIVLDISAGQVLYKPFYKHAHYVALDFAGGDSSWDYSKLDIVADAMHLPIRNSSIDIALNFTSLEHYPKPWEFFAEVSRVLKPGGKLFLFVPFVQQEHQVPYDFYRYTQYALKEFCTQSGLIAEEVKPVCSVFVTAWKFFDFLKMSVQAIGVNQEVYSWLLQTQDQLKSIAKQFDAAAEGNESAQLAVSQLPMQYMLRAAKPGVLVPEKHPTPRHELLSEILADPFEKKPIAWDGVATEIFAPHTSRRYPVIGGVPRFMQ